jgi:LemA protein
MTAWIILAVLVALGVALVVWSVGVYNGLVALRNRYKNAYSQIDVQLTRRYDLIPNLVETVKGYMAHEHGTLEDVIKARSAAVAAQTRAAGEPGEPAAMHGLLAADAGLTGALGRLMVLSESYPQLKADANVKTLTDELTGTENRIAFARQAYNDMVMAYNTAREQVPGNLVAGFGNFTAAALWEAENPAAVRQAPVVKF